MVFQEQLFTEKECEFIISLSKPITSTPSDNSFDINTGKVYYSDESFKKSYNVSSIINNKKSAWIFERLLKWFSEKTNTPLKDGITANVGLLHSYTVGDCFAKHIDINDTFINRRYNIGIQLNNDYKGGDYNYWIGNEIYSFSKVPGTAILYSVDLLHEITEITEGNRISFVTHIGKELIKTKSLL